MSITLALLAILFSFVIGAIFGGMVLLLSRRIIFNRQLRIAESKAAKMLLDAKNEAKDVLSQTQEEAKRVKATADNEYRERRSELQKQENSVNQKNETLDRKLEGVDQRERNLVNKEKEIENTRAQVTELKDKQMKQLELISGMTSGEAKQNLLDAMEVELGHEASRRLASGKTNSKKTPTKKRRRSWRWRYSAAPRKSSRKPRSPTYPFPTTK